MENEGDMLVAAPGRWDEACFAVPALRALIASGLGVGVLCREEQQEFWRTLDGLQVCAFPSKAKAKHAKEEEGSDLSSPLEKSEKEKEDEDLAACCLCHCALDYSDRSAFFKADR